MMQHNTQQPSVNFQMIVSEESCCKKQQGHSIEWPCFLFLAVRLKPTMEGVRLDPAPLPSFGLPKSMTLRGLEPLTN